MRVQIPPRPKRKLGQNFLHDENVIDKIFRFIQPSPSDYFFEIGGGTGALTEPLASRIKKLIVAEIDSELIPYLSAIPNVNVLKEDARKISICEFPESKSWRIVGNLPYYISSSILTSLLEQRDCIQDMTLMFQEEVAMRIIAPPSDSEYGMLSVLAQYYCTIQRGFRISRNSFSPKPDIESRLIRLVPRAGKRLAYEEYAAFLSDAFSQRRKKLRNNLLRTAKIAADRLDLIFAELQIAADARAENLSADQFEALYLRLMP
jgi:16S rRNA (adenine1518-N6/adenine1519-N6)-dimethyltransferase